jgi:hypothetical protein
VTSLVGAVDSDIAISRLGARQPSFDPQPTTPSTAPPNAATPSAYAWLPAPLPTMSAQASPSAAAQAEPATRRLPRRAVLDGARWRARAMAVPGA